MKKLLLIIAITSYLFSNAQDVIIKKDGNELKVKVIEIALDNVKYKKADNIDGPLYNISKNEIFMIKYQNGDKDVFNVSSDKKNTAIVKKTVPIIKDVEKYNIPNSKSMIVFDYQLNKQKVFDANSIFYYGFDFSNMILVNSKKIGQEQKMNKYFTAWLSDFEGVVPFKKIKHYLKKDFLINVKTNIQSRYFINTKKNWIASSDNNIDIDDVFSLVGEYMNVINEKKGIGLVGIVESFNKSEERVSIIFTFFDVETGEVLWVTKAKGKSGGKGFTRHWTIGMMESLRNYIAYSYKPTTKEIYKSINENP